MKIRSLHIYPIKSLGGFSLPASKVTLRGLENDRRWMLVDEQNKFITQREFPKMALFAPEIINEKLMVSFEGSSIEMPLKMVGSETKETVSIWSSKCKALVAAPQINEWYSQMLGTWCKAVFMPDETKRKPHFAFAKSPKDLVSFADGFPLLFISDNSLQDLNGKLANKVEMNRFRPSIVIDDAPAFSEDDLKQFEINGTQYFGVKPCARCIIVNTDQATAKVSKDPLKTLATYRTKNKKVIFGMNVIPEKEGILQVGDSINLL